MGNNCNTWWQKMGWFTIKTPLEFYEIGDTELAKQKGEGKSVRGRRDALENAGYCIDFDYSKLTQDAPRYPSKLWTSCVYGSDRSVEVRVKDDGFYFTVQANDGGWGGVNKYITASFKNDESPLNWEVSTNFLKFDLSNKTDKEKSGEGFKDFCTWGFGKVLQKWYDGGLYCVVSSADKGDSSAQTAKFLTLVHFVKGVEELVCH